MGRTFFDAHFHIIDKRFPLIPNQGYLPEAYTIDDYRRGIASDQILGGAVVSGSFQGFEQGYLINALSQLGDGFVGVTQIPSSYSDSQIVDLHGHGVRAIRFNLYRGPKHIDSSELLELALRVWELCRWHVELYLDSTQLQALSSLLERLPLFSIDHLGLNRDGISNILHWVQEGAHIKATGFSRCDFDVGKLVQMIYQTNPDSLIFGTDLPSTRAPQPYSRSDADSLESKILEIGGKPERVFLSNAQHLYINRFEDEMR